MDNDLEKGAAPQGNAASTIPSGGSVERKSAPLPENAQKVITALVMLRGLEMRALEKSLSETPSPAKDGMKEATARAAIAFTSHPVGMLPYDVHAKMTEAAKNPDKAIPDLTGVRLPLGIISEAEQEAMQRAREAALSNEAGPGVRDFSWTGSDADGNPKSTMQALLKARYDVTLPDQASFAEAMAASVKAAQTPLAVAPQFRISTEDKKGMAGVERYLAVIDEGVRNARGANNAEKFAAYVETLRYVSPAKAKGNPEELAKQGVLDFMMRAFTSPGEEMVLSDYPASGKVLEGLMNVRGMVSAELQRRGLPDLAANKRFLPLAESEPSVKAVGGVLDGLLTDANRDARDWKIEGGGRKSGDLSRVGMFVGPSDVTRMAGGVAPVLLYNALKAAAALSEKLNVDIALQYGQGTSPRRGSQVAFSGVNLLTVQGTSSVAHFAKSARPGARGAVFEPSEAFIKGASDFHHALWRPEALDGEAKGALPAWFDEALKTRPALAAVTDGAILNNNGVRSKPGLSEYGQLRAIPSADVATLSGSLTAPGFPERMEGVDLKGMMACPLAGAVVLDQLRQVAAMDNKRSEMAGVPQEVTARANAFATRFLNKLAEATEQSRPESGDDVSRRLAAKQLAEAVALRAEDPETKRGASVLAEGVQHITVLNEALNRNVSAVLAGDGKDVLPEKGKMFEPLKQSEERVAEFAGAAFTLTALTNAPSFISRVGVGGARSASAGRGL